MDDRILRIGCASGFWGDSATAAPQLLDRARLDYLVFDYLSEITMSLLARARQRDPEAGYTGDFVDPVMKAILPRLAAQGVRVVANAGGINPRSCKRALEALCAEAGVALKVAIVEGDDLMPLADALRADGVREAYSGAPLPDRLLTANAYLGAWPIAAALAGGADIVVTGRCADSALVLGPLIHEFGWTARDLDLLAAGSLAGHVLECGAQATGGIHTDWRAVQGWEDIGYPVAECRADGGFVLTKPEGTGGRVTRATVAEQILYEIGDPAAYVLPDVVVDLTGVRVRTDGPDRVEVTGARGLPPTPSYKVSATWQDGWRATALVTIVGPDAAEKAERTADAILGRTRTVLGAAGLDPVRATHREVLGAEASYGPRSRARASREVILRLSVEHDRREALDLFAREIAAAATSWAPGTTGFLGGRPRPQPIVRLFSMLVDKARLPPPTITIAGADPIPVALPAASDRPSEAASVVAPPPGPGPEGADEVEVPLVRLAWARSGDKGDWANIGVIARRPAYLDALRRALSPEIVAGWFAHLVAGPVDRYEVPGLGAFNFVLQGALGGGGIASARIDPQGKAYAQMLLEMPVRVPRGLLDGETGS